MNNDEDVRVAALLNLLGFAEESSFLDVEGLVLDGWFL
jgi:hypothetical protein